MKRLFLFILVLISIHSHSQVSFAGKLNGSTITLDELLNEKELKLNNNEGVITGFNVSTFIQADGLIAYKIEYSESNQITEEQKNLFKSAESSSKIYFDDIRVRLTNGSIVNYPRYFLVKDGPNANLLKDDYSDNKMAFYLYKHPRIYGYPSYYSFDTTQYKIISFKIKSTQKDFYYEFESNNNMLTPEMANFVKTSTVDFSICDIQALDKNNKTIYLHSLSIKPWYPSKIIRSKNQLLTAKNIDLIAHSSNIKIKWFEIYIPSFGGGFLPYDPVDDADEEKSFVSKSDEITAEMKTFITNSEVGDILHFRLHCNNSNGKVQKREFDVLLTD